jgi:uncharacterized protein (TIGR00369 family)
MAPQSFAPPDGYEPLFAGHLGLSGLTGPYFVRMSKTAPVLGFRVEERHLNPSGVCHGGALAAFADHLAVIVRHIAGVTDFSTPTVTLSIGYIAPVPSGSWVEMHGRLLRRTKTLLFGDGLMQVDGAVMTRIDAIFTLGRPRADLGFDIPPGVVSAV